MSGLLRSVVLSLLAGTMLAADTAVLVPGENLVVRGIPPIPQSIAATIAQYSDFRQAASVAWRGSSRELLIATRFGAAYEFHIVRSPEGARTQLTFTGGGIATTSPSDAQAVSRPDGGAFVYVRDVANGKELNQLFLFDMETGRTTMLTDGESRNDSPVWAPDGKLLAYASTKRNGTDWDIVLMNPAERASPRPLGEFAGSWIVLDWSPDGTTLLASQMLSSSETKLWLINVTDGARRELRFGERPSLAADARFGGSASTVFVSSDVDGEFLRLLRVDVTTGRVTPFTAAVNGDVEAISVSGDGRWVAAAVNEQGLGRLHVYDARNGRARALPRLPAGSVLSVRWRPGSSELAFDVNSSRHPRDAFSVDLAAGRVYRWTASEMNAVDPDELVEAELVRWKSFDDQTITGFLFRPPRRFAGPRPVIVNIHGGPAQQERPRFLGFSNYFINELGIAVLYPNVRGSTGFGRSFRNADDGMKREDPVKDLGALLDWIGEQPDLDASRVMVTGASFGGYLTYAVATTYPDRIKCAFAAAAISSLVTDLERTSPDGQAQRRAEYGDERVPEMRAFLEGVAPLSHAARISKPLFIAHGQNDPRVPVQEAEQMAAAVEKNGSPLWYLVVKDEGHGVGVRPASREYLFSAWVLFVQEHLLK
jgi:dipeptidyl aminopeptidase/acylaminoacyl peptidase